MRLRWEQISGSEFSSAVFRNQSTTYQQSSYFWNCGQLESFLTIPLLFCGAFSADDLLPFHLRWSKHFAEQFWSGELYPRWLMGMNAGLGSPTFFFYTPIPYYFTSLLHPLFASDPQGWHQLGLSASFALIASGITAYIWPKKYYR